MKGTILVVSQDKVLLEQIQQIMPNLSDYQVGVWPDVQLGTPDQILVVTSVGDDSASLEHIRNVRGAGSYLILAVSENVSQTTVAVILDCGADACLLRPFEPRLLLATIKALLRRVNHQSKVIVVTAGDVTIDLEKLEVTKAGERVDLTPMEWEFLAFLAQTPNKVVSKRDLASAVWGFTDAKVDKYCNTFAYRIRKKIEDDPARPKTIVTKARMGYLIVAGS